MNVPSSNAIFSPSCQKAQTVGQPTQPLYANTRYFHSFTALNLEYIIYTYLGKLSNKQKRKTKLGHLQTSADTPPLKCVDI